MSDHSSSETAPPKTVDHQSPSRSRHTLADAIAEIIRNDATPPRLRDAVVNYVTDSASPQPAADLHTPTQRRATKKERQPTSKRRETKPQKAGRLKTL